MKNFAVVFCVLCVLVSGCVKRSVQTPEIPPADPTDTALSKAAMEIQKDLRMLAGTDYDGPPNTGGENLAGKAIYKFNGEIEDLVRDIGRNIGYNAEFMGKAPAQAIMVSVYSPNPRSYFDILQTAGVQAGDRANITVNDVTKTITLSYDGIDINTPAWKIEKKPGKYPARMQNEKNNSNYAQAVKGLGKQGAIAGKRPVSAGAKTSADMGSMPAPIPQNIIQGSASQQIVPSGQQVQTIPVKPVSDILSRQYNGQPVQITVTPAAPSQVVMNQSYNTPAYGQLYSTPVQPQVQVFEYNGGILGLHKRLGEMTGYQLRIDGPASDIPVRVRSGANVQDIVGSVNSQIKDASIFVDSGNNLVVLRFWR